MGEKNFKTLKKDFPELFSDEVILMGYRGSIAHGTYVPNSNPNSIDDKDVMGIVIPELKYYFGLYEWGNRGTREIMKDEWDIVLYEVRKFIGLLAKGNPNVLSLLWLEENDYIHKTEIGELLIQNRDLFATRQVYHSFVGYAHGQLHRMTHYKFEGYMGQKRKTLVEKYKFDCKNASHLIRLLRMGIEFLREGYLYVKRQDATQLLEIKHGEWSLEKVKEEADRLFKRAEIAYDQSTLPARPDMGKINDLCVEMCSRKQSLTMEK